MDVEAEGGDQAKPHEPQEHRPGQQRDEHVAEELAVDVGVVLHDTVVLDDPEVQLQVADHVGDDEAEQHEAGDGHHPLLADRCLVEAERGRVSPSLLAEAAEASCWASSVVGAAT